MPNLDELKAQLDKISQEIEALIERIAKEEGFGPAVAKRIAFCESSFDPLARSKTSSAKGLYQFLDGSWNYYGFKLWGNELKSKDPFNAVDKIDLAMYVMGKRGFKDWEASKHCWR